MTPDERIKLLTEMGGFSETTARAIIAVASDIADAELKSMAGLVMERVQEAERKGVSRANMPIEDVQTAILSAFAERLGE